MWVRYGGGTYICVVSLLPLLPHIHLACTLFPAIWLKSKNSHPESHPRVVLQGHVGLGCRGAPAAPRIPVWRDWGKPFQVFWASPVAQWLKKKKFHLQSHTLEKGMTARSSILAWKNPMDTGTWQATVCGVAKSQTTSEVPSIPNILGFLNSSSTCDPEVFPTPIHGLTQGCIWV